MVAEGKFAVAIHRSDSGGVAPRWSLFLRTDRVKFVA
jgi:hypothetical protein